MKRRNLLKGMLASGALWWVAGEGPVKAKSEFKKDLAKDAKIYYAWPMWPEYNERDWAYYWGSKEIEPQNPKYIKLVFITYAPICNGDYFTKIYFEIDHWVDDPKPFSVVRWEAWKRFKNDVLMTMEHYRVDPSMVLVDDLTGAPMVYKKQTFLNYRSPPRIC